MRNPNLIRMLATAPLLLACPAHAQDAGGTQTLKADYFEKYAPVTALDMVQRIAGFSIEGGEGRRGFGDNAGNVLIDGERPSTKSDDIFAVLSRISASQVDYIEVSQQAGSDGEARGKAQVVNVILKRSAKITGTYDANVQIGERYGVTGFGTISASIRRGATSFEINAGNFQELQRGYGPEDFSDGARNLLERRYYEGRGGYGEQNLGGAIKTRIGNVTVNTNAKIKRSDGFDDRDGSIASPIGTPTGIEILRVSAPDTSISYEFGGDIAFPLAAKLASKIIALYRNGQENSRSRVDTSFFAGTTASFETTNRNRPGEMIFRMQNDWTGLSGHAVQFGAEVAVNRLRANFSAASSTNGAVTIFPPSNVRVGETRFEPFVSDVVSLGPTLKIEGGVIFETSRLNLSGDSKAKRSFQFLKPRLVATWTVDKATAMEFRAQRQVSQLDFNEFATSVDVGAGGQVDAGNADLVPEKTATLTALVRHKFMERGSIQLQGNYVFVNDTQDLVPVTIRDAGGMIVSRFDGTGNIGSSRRWDIEAEITLPFDWLTKPLGISGMELKYVAHYHGSRVTDPVTDAHRRMSGRPLWHQSWEFRHDLGKSGIGWGFTAFVAAPAQQYFFNQLRETREEARVSAFVEYKKFPLGTLRVQAFNITNAEWQRDRFFFRDTRNTGQLSRIIERSRFLDTRFQVSLNGKF